MQHTQLIHKSFLSAKNDLNYSSPRHDECFEQLCIILCGLGIHLC